MNAPNDMAATAFTVDFLSIPTVRKNFTSKPGTFAAAFSKADGGRFDLASNSGVMTSSNTFESGHLSGILDAISSTMMMDYLGSPVPLTIHS